MRLILASGSPQRSHLLKGLGVRFVVEQSSVDERLCAERDPVPRAKVLSALKAREVFARNKDAVVVGCDTLVTVSTGLILEKPLDAEDARRMILLQSGQTSLVYSGVTVIGPSIPERTELSVSSVIFAPLMDAQISWWIDTGLWRGRSGAFQIDGPGQLMISRIEGDFTGVVGLPVFLLGTMLRDAGVECGHAPARKRTERYSC